MKILGIDQSLAKCAMVLMEDGQPLETLLSKTGASTVKTKRKDTTYYPELKLQIHHICKEFMEVVTRFEPDVICFEALSFGSSGNATRNLAELHGALMETLLANNFQGEILDIPPTTLKSYAWNYLEEETKWEGLTKAKKPKKIKMDKKMMVQAVKNLYGENYLTGYNYSSGLDDLTDATFLAHKCWTENEKT